MERSDKGKFADALFKVNLISKFMEKIANNFWKLFVNICFILVFIIVPAVIALLPAIPAIFSEKYIYLLGLLITVPLYITAMIYFTNKYITS
jgi:hypothetical protein